MEKNDMITFREMVRDAAAYLEAHYRCPKHHVEHTGNLCYLLDLYSYLGDIEKGKRMLDFLVEKIVDTPGGAVFYPGHQDPMNMSQNVIDAGAAVDCMARFLHMHREALPPAEHERYGGALRRVVEPYLKTAALGKPITNQRLWGLTGLASYARYVGTNVYSEIIVASIEQAFADMTADGFFIYMPHAEAQGNFSGYDGFTTFYQSRCSAFIRYSLEAAGVDAAPYEERLRKSEQALLAQYRADGTKDLRLECKRWYWLSPYEVASAGFDGYALARSAEPAAHSALQNLFFQVRRHFSGGYLHSHIGAPINFQCPIFWTAHLAWLTRIPGVEAAFDSANTLAPFSYALPGEEVFTDTTPHARRLLDRRFQERNFNEGIYDNGLPDTALWRFKFPKLPPAFFFGVRETLNHGWYALRGGYVREALMRGWLLARELFVMCLPRFSARYGKITAVKREGERWLVSVTPATKYGTLLEGVTMECIL